MYLYPIKKDAGSLFMTLFFRYVCLQCFPPLYPFQNYLSLVKTQVARLYSHIFLFNVSGMGVKICVFILFPDNAIAGPTL